MVLVVCDAGVTVGGTVCVCVCVSSYLGMYHEKSLNGKISSNLASL